ncbi:muscarinic acetylcholine receptor M3-like [Mercenaria mercenaria]|uniref:muscarinic acetylcholine receptor M3-like n=1 Tax=Mercenaria mercenaria TaxID=6596 RepID=UPI00234F63B2|nr:muscarinic acetylcholine receptor M3-like [Mercenaria mercenaria]XP_053382164.1 muscarinic acetylcholine receptor M3-like [Mercenaria mercenaria]XP_053382165.1 muscarinic acetylcholine receptor M3-like [Mercenaria mercenaria]
MTNTTMAAATTSGGMNIAGDIPTLEAMNNAEVEKLIPTIVFLMIVCVIGVVGNILVIHVYRTRFKMSNSKCFILCLSAVDLLTCCIAIPLEVSTILEQYTFEHLWLCKTSRVFNTLGTISSSFILLFIAVDRFRKVCKPFGWQIKTTVAKLLCGLALFCGIMVSWPAIFIYGKHTFDIPEYNMTGTECSTADGMIDTKFPFFYALVFGFMFTAGIIAMSILYCFIGHKVRKHTRKMKEVLGRNMSIPMTSSIIDTRDSKVVGEIDADAMAKYDIANNKNEQIRKKRSTKKKKQETDDSWTDKKDYELSYTFSQESREKEKSQENLNNIDELENDFHEKKEDQNSDSEDSGIKTKEEAETDEKTQKEIKNGDIEVKYSKKGEISFQNVEPADIKADVSPTSSEEILPKQKGVFRRVSSISNRISNAFLRMASVASVRSSSDPGTLKRTQFLKQARARKTAFLMFVVTLGFILSFLPHLLLMLIRQMKTDFVDGMSDTNKAVYKFFLRSYFLNSAINPVIYSICDSRFKSACKEIFGHCFGGSGSRNIKV